MELVPWSPPGFPAGCQVTSQNSGPPENIWSKRLMRLAAPAAVFGGKNSNEKNFSLFLIFACTCKRGNVSVHVVKAEVQFAHSLLHHKTQNGFTVIGSYKPTYITMLMCACVGGGGGACANVLTLILSTKVVGWLGDVDLVEDDEQKPLSTDVDALRLKSNTGADETRGKPLDALEPTESERSNSQTLSPILFYCDIIL